MVSGLKECDNELVVGGEGAEVESEEELEEDVIAKNVGEDNRGKVIVGREIGVGDDENGEGGAVQEIRSEGHEGGE